MSSAEQSSRPQTLSASNSGHSHGRQIVKTRPPTPDSRLGVAHPSVPSVPYAKPQPALREQSYSAGTPVPSPILTPRRILEYPTARYSPASLALRRRLLSPTRHILTADPPSHLRCPPGLSSLRISQKLPFAALNLTHPSGTPLRHHDHTGSISSPHSPLPSPDRKAHSTTPPHSATVNQAQQVRTSRITASGDPRT